MNNDMLGYLVNKQNQLDDIVEELARVGYPECNTEEAQERAARNLGYRDAEDMYDLLTEDDIKYIKRELRQKLL
jgi:hypothetical protein